MKRTLAEVPPGKCPGCRTADLTFGRKLCQACEVAKVMQEANGR